MGVVLIACVQPELVMGTAKAGMLFLYRINWIWYRIVQNGTELIHAEISEIYENLSFCLFVLKSFPKTVSRTLLQKCAPWNDASNGEGPVPPFSPYPLHRIQVLQQVILYHRN